MFFKEILEQAGPGRAFLEYLQTQILKILLPHTNHGGFFCGFIISTGLS